MDELRACNSCKVEKPFTSEYFVVDPKRKSGLRGVCKQCKNDKIRQLAHSRGVKPIGVIPDTITCYDCGEEKPTTKENFCFMNGRPLLRCLTCINERRRRKRNGESLDPWRGCNPDDKFFYLTAVSWESSDRNGNKWLFDCICGNQKTAYIKHVKSGSIQSCGCMRSETLVNNATKHGMSKHPLYQTWDNMMQRCYNPKHPEYVRYGERGIIVCDEWKESPAAFFDHIGEKPSSEHSIDRINNDGNYEPGNVRWATTAEQGLNKRSTKTKNIVVEVGEVSDSDLRDWKNSPVKEILLAATNNLLPDDLIFIDRLGQSSAIFNGTY